MFLTPFPCNVLNCSAEKYSEHYKGDNYVGMQKSTCDCAEIKRELRTCLTKLFGIFVVALLVYAVANCEISRG